MRCIRLSAAPRPGGPPPPRGSAAVAGRAGPPLAAPSVLGAPPRGTAAIPHLRRDTVLQRRPSLAGTGPAAADISRVSDRFPVFLTAGGPGIRRPRRRAPARRVRWGRGGPGSAREGQHGLGEPLPADVVVGGQVHGGGGGGGRESVVE